VTKSLAADVDARLALCVSLGICVLTWMLSHGYLGLHHDARLYTLQALARLEPDSLANDVFLRHGSQDRFTIFSPVYALAMRLLGVEAAAAALTLLSQIALCVAAHTLARAVMPPRLALLGVAVLIAIPGDYGAARVFACIEPFLTPRMGAEALVLAGLAAALRGRRAASLVGVGAAACVHPPMAAAGLVALLWLLVVEPRPRRAIALIAALVFSAAVMAFLMPPGEMGRFDSEWLRLVMERNPNLFLGFWQLDDWVRAAIVMVTLTIGARMLPGASGRRLAAAAAICCGAGLLLTWLTCDQWHLVLFTQLQPWRWQWLATVVAALLLAPIVQAGWRTEGVGRVTCVLLPAAWLFGEGVFALAVLATLAGLLIAARLRRWSAAEGRLAFWGGAASLALAVLWRVASNLEFTTAFFLDGRLPLWFRRTASFCHDGALPVALMVIAWWLGRAPRQHRAALWMFAALAAGGVAILIAPVWNSWTAREFTAQRFAEFAPFRAQIPPGTDVFWPEMPLGTWMLLERPNFLSGFQASGMLFSRAAALEMQRRAQSLADVVPPAEFLGWNSGALGLRLSAQQLRGACAVVDYLVTQVDIGRPPLAVVAPPPGASGRDATRLYRCRAAG
jgi:hypothetical protein